MIQSLPPSTYYFPRFTKVIVVLDVVESVRLMEQNASDFIQRWHRFGEAARQRIAQHGGRTHKSLGDGLMLEFADAQAAIRTAFALQQLSRQRNIGMPPERHMHLRIGAHVAEFVADEHDIYGIDVNLAARIGTLAGPGEVVVSAALRDALTDALDAEIQDLGDCHLKHVAEPVRAYRVGEPGTAAVVAPASQYVELQPTIAVIPFVARSNQVEQFAIGELIAEGLIAQLGRTPQLRVISRLSSSAFRGRPTGVAEISQVLGANYVLSGSYVASGSKLLVTAELADSTNSEVKWCERIHSEEGDLLQTDSELCHRIASAVHTAIMQTEVQRALVRPLPTLQSCSLLLGGIALTHRAGSRDFGRAHEVLNALVERHPRSAQARAWLAKWYILRAVRGMSDVPDKDARRAIEETQRALDSEPESALALAVQGHALCQLSGDTDGAAQRIDRAIALSPNDPLGWLYKSVWSSMWGSTETSVEEAETAARLSPIDPMKYYYDTILATALSTHGQHERAIEVARRSLKANRYHQPTMRPLIYSLVENGHLDEARAVLKDLLEQSPNFTIAGYLGLGGAQSRTRPKVAGALRRLGVPEN
ncbi:MAG: tetratricopeptide repeat protein [Ramlibacter sp.]|nr:tetratricopeptide repeat protein [Ramlibacter sp.]